MSCINVKLFRLATPINLSVASLNKKLNINCLNITKPIEGINIVLTNPRLDTSVIDLTSRLKVNMGIVCSINNDKSIRFSNRELIWKSEDNYVGVTKYNLLTSAEDWILEEIEELL